MSVNSKMTAIADAIRGKTGKTDSLTLDQMATEIAGIETGGGSGGGSAELVFETTFSVAETLTSGKKVNIATINTGLTGDSFAQGDSYILVLKCTNDTEQDMSFNHVVGRIALPCDNGEGYFDAGSGSGFAVYRKPDESLSLAYGGTYGLYPGSTGKYLASLTLMFSYHATWGALAAGDYSLKLYKLNRDFFGIGGLLE